MRLLKRTSKHHRPAHLAAAVALGILVGLVPKANLLAVGLYAALLLLPIHTFLALAVSVVVACVAGYLDPLTGALGSWLLQRPRLGWLWHFFDNTAVLPWLGLHNTVVLGSLASGLALAAPSYFVSLRLFERMRSRATRRPGDELESTTILVPQPAPPAIIPAPKFVDLPLPIAAVAAAQETCDSPVEEEEFEPAREVAAIINSWHVAHVAESNLQPRLLSASGTPAAHALSNSTSASPSPTPSPSQSMSSIYPSDVSSEGSFRPHPFTPPPRPWEGERSEIVDSLDLAHSASEVLAWVDGMLEECLSEDSTRMDAQERSRTTAGPDARAQVAPAEPQRSEGDTLVGDVDGLPEEQWLMETTIEVVRWGEGSPPAIAPIVTRETSEASAASQAHAGQSTQPATSADSTADTSRGYSASFPAAHRPLPRTVDLGEAYRNALERGRPSIVQFIQPGLPAQPPAEPADRSQGADALEPPRGECLGYLLGHLRQEREGRSS